MTPEEMVGKKVLHRGPHDRTPSVKAVKTVYRTSKGLSLELSDGNFVDSDEAQIVEEIFSTDSPRDITAEVIFKEAQETLRRFKEQCSGDGEVVFLFARQVEAVAELEQALAAIEVRAPNS